MTQGAKQMMGMRGGKWSMVGSGNHCRTSVGDGEALFLDHHGDSALGAVTAPNAELLQNGRRVARTAKYFPGGLKAIGPVQEGIWQFVARPPAIIP